MTKALAGLVVMLAVGVATAQAQPQPQPVKFVRFQSPSKNIGCIYAPAAAGRAAYLRCDILSGLRPAPKGSCRLDWTGFTMVGRTRPRPTCAGDTVYEPGARILRYGSTWRGAGFVCRSRRSELRCTNAVRRGFSLSRMRSYTF